MVLELLAKLLGPRSRVGRRHRPDRIDAYSLYSRAIRGPLIAAVILTAGAVLGGCGPASSTDSTEPVGEIAYSAWDGAQHAIYVVRTDGSGIEKVASGTDGAPSWSPDGTQLAVADCADDTEEYCTLRVQAGNVERRVTRIDYGEPAWSPDGTEIALVRCDDAEESACAVFVVPVEGGTHRRVTPEGLFGQPAWSPDGRRIALAALRRGIFVVASDGSGVVWSTFGDGDPAWSPDGRQLAFMRAERLAEREVRYDLYVIDADGTGTRRITDGSANADSPAWSPDGTKLAFVQWTGEGECPSVALFVAEADGNNPRRLTPYRPLNADPVWSPDGSQIAFTRIEECWSDEDATLWLVSARGGEARQVSPVVRPDAGVKFAWRPG